MLTKLCLCLLLFCELALNLKIIRDSDVVSDIGKEAGWISILTCYNMLLAQPNVSAWKTNRDLTPAWWTPAQITASSEIATGSNKSVFHIIYRACLLNIFIFMFRVRESIK